MSVASALARGRAAAEALMVDTCTIQRPTGSTTDHLTGAVTPGYTTVYSGRCKAQAAGGRSIGQRSDPGDVSVVTKRLELHLPLATSAGIRRGDVVTITASQHDPDLPSRTWTVYDEMRKSFATARRLGLEEAT